MGSLVGQTESERPPGAAAGRRDGPVRRRSSTRSRRRWPASPSGGQADCGRLGPAVRHAADLAQRPRERRLRRLHGQRRLASCRRSSRRAERFDGDVLPRPARAARRRRRSGGCTSTRYGLDPGQRAPARPRLDRRRDQGVLPAGGAARRPAGRGGAEHRAGGRHGRRVGRAAAGLGQRPLPVAPTAPASTPAAAPRPTSPAATSAAATRRPTEPRRTASTGVPSTRHPSPRRRAARPVASSTSRRLR